jgi:prepilin-type N-terminal cleavage/methylation domain-containing protein
MRTKRGFTLAEMMVVIGIMLILMTAAVGILSTLSEQSVTDKAMSEVQAMLNGARDYAASNNVTTQVRFDADPDNIFYGTVMKLQTLTGNTWADVPGSEVKLGFSAIVCRKMPDSLPSPPGVSVSQIPTDAEVQAWKNYRVSLLAALTTFAMGNTTPPKLKTVDTQGFGLTQFGVVFDPTGYLATNQNPASEAAQAGDPIYALTIVQIGGTKVINYAFFPLNAASGTRIYFE